MRFSRMLLAGLLLLASVTPAARAQDDRPRGGEPFHRFLDALRARKYFDIANEYLEEMRTSPLIDAETKASIPYQEGQTLVQQADAERDPSQRLVYLEQAIQKYDEFVKANPDHPLAGTAQMQTGTVEVERGQVDLYKRDRANGQGEKDALTKSAQAHFDAALKVFTDAETSFQAQLAKFPKFIDEKQRREIEAREIVRSNMLQAQILAATALYESSKVHQHGSTAEKQALQAAADRYDKINAEHRDKVVGLLARLKQGQCYQDMGDYRRALGLYADILSQNPDLSPDVRDIRASAMYLSMQSWLAEEKYDVAMKQAEDFIHEDRGFENKPDWLAIRFLLATAQIKAAKLLPEKDPQVPKLFEAAKKNLQDVIDHPNSFQNEAKALIVEAGGTQQNLDEIKTFADGFTKAQRDFFDLLKKKDAYDAAVQANAPIEERDEKKAAYLESRANALASLNLALSLREKDSDMDNVNSLRFYLAHVNFLKENFYDAAVLGEFVARTYPNSSVGREAARTAMASYVGEYNKRSADERDFELDGLANIVEYISTRWEKGDDVDAARNVMMAVYVNEHNLPEAAKWLNKVPEDSSNRASSELKLGQAYWQEYQKLVRRPENDRPSKDELNKTVADAQKLLENGLNRLKQQGGVTPELIAAELSTAQIYIMANQPAKALELLEDSQFGPLALLAGGDPIVSTGNIPLVAYQIGLRAYVQSKQLDKAEVMLKKLEEIVDKPGPNGAVDKSMLTKILIEMGLELRQQLKTLTEANRMSEVKEVTQSYEALLDKIASRDAGNNFRSLNWVADTFFNMGQGQDIEGKPAPPDAVKYYTKTHETDAKILAKFQAKDPNFALTPPEVLALQMRQANVLRRLKKYKESLELLAGILEANANVLPAHEEAARAYMDMGRDENPLYYNLAVRGARKRQDKPDQPLFWGWAGIGNKLIANKDPKLRELSLEARWQAANCLLLQADNVATPADKKGDLLNDAERSIRYIYVTDHEMGGEEMKKRFDRVLKDVQKLQGKSPVGLKAFDAKPKSASTTAASP